MSNILDYIIDLRGLFFDIDTAALLAAEYKIIYIIDNECFDNNIPAGELYDDIVYLKVNTDKIKLDDLISILSFKFDFSNAYVAVIENHNIVPKQKSANNIDIQTLRKAGICSPFEIKKISRQFLPNLCFFYDVQLQTFVSTIVTSMDNICYKELLLFCGSIGFTDIEIHNARYSTYKESLEFNEMRSLIKYYDSILKNNTLPKEISSLVTYRKQRISYILNSLYNNQGGFTEFSGFPVVFKYLSAYLLLCAQYKASFEMFNSAFLYAFRSLDWLCDGILIMNGNAKIHSNGNKIDELFIIDNGKLQKPMGFGSKWKVLLSCPIFIQLLKKTKDILSEYILIRNHHAMTHGTLRISETYFHNFQKNIIDFFTQVDMATNANGFTFNKVLEIIKEIFEVNYSIFIFEAILEKFDFELHAN